MYIQIRVAHYEQHLNLRILPHVAEDHGFRRSDAWSVSVPAPSKEEESSNRRGLR